MIVRVNVGPVGYEVEMGRATVEVVLPPVDDLHALPADRAATLFRRGGVDALIGNLSL